MNANSTRYSIKIPNNVEVLNNYKDGYILIKGSLSKKLYKSFFKTQLCNDTKTLYVTNEVITKLSNSQKKNQKSLRGTVVAMISKYILEVSSLTYKTLNLKGVGFKVFSLDNQILHFKLGFSHNIYFKVSEGLKTNAKHSSKLVIFGNNSLLINQTASLIKKFKTPEPYKGKGILYSNEQIKLKEGKKV